jgi:ATP-dependent DNA helicase RecG
LAAAIDAVRRPLCFAAEDEFARVERIRNLEDSVAGAASRAASLSIPPDARLIFEKVARCFASPVEGEARIAAVRESLDLLQPLRDPRWAEQALVRPVGRLPGIGPRRAEALAKRGLPSVVGLLFRLPSRYDDRRTFVPIGDLEVGSRATLVGEVLSTEFVARRGRGRRLFQALVGDETGAVTLKWFRGGEAVRTSLRKGRQIRVTGDVRRYRFSRELIHPEIDLLGEEEDPDAMEPRIVPDYGAPEGIPPRTFRRVVRAAVNDYADLLPNHLPQDLARERGLPSTAAALRWIHDPDDDADLDALRDRDTPAHQRLVLEELFLLEVGLAERRAKRAGEPGIAIEVTRPRIDAAENALPFRLTPAQRRAWAEIRADLGRPHPMSRLLQGDVGSGKTVVAFLAAIAASENGFQTALMAPTELLAEQHERTLQQLAAGGGEATSIRIALLTASVPRSEAREIRARLGRGEVDLVVGTHALVQGEVEFARLALAVVDEQHRFGVLQRAALARKAHAGLSPHTLVMTATPIPRSLALTVYGDLDLSVIEELPPGRRPPQTVLLRAGEGQRVIELIRETVARGEQVYVVYPLVEESEKIDLRAAVESTERIRAAFPALRVDLVHGRLDVAARGAAMAQFAGGSTHILVSTTVIEVGVDIPNATLMVVEHAERFGLAQLHQLRGRVGRGDRLGTCVLVARAVTEDSEARLRAMLETCDGFRIADADLRIRGPGEFLGTRQHGRLPDLRIADLVRDTRWVSLAREAALATVRRDPGLLRAPDLARAVRLRWGERLALAEVG